MNPSFTSWALLDRATGSITGSANFDTALTTTQSMIKSWIVADFLRDTSPTDSQLAQAEAAIVDSDDDAAESLFRAGGSDAQIARLIEICGLTETQGVPGWWSMTTMSARDAVRMGLALADGRAAGPQWTPWLLDTMRRVSPDGRWGIVDGLPSRFAADQLAIKNGWTQLDDGEWDVNCLAVHASWILAVLVGYPGDEPLSAGADLARTITTTIFTTL